MPIKIGINFELSGFAGVLPVECGTAAQAIRSLDQLSATLKRMEATFHDQAQQ